MLFRSRYAVMGIKEISYFGLNADGSDNIDWNQTYGGFYDEEKAWDKPYPKHWVKEKEEKDEWSYTY